MKIAIVGAGISGLAAIKKLQNDDLFLSESKPILDERTKKILKKYAVPFEIGGHSSKLLNSDMIIVSPGVSLNNPIIKQAIQKGIPVISEIELAYKYMNKPIIAVTGTNGKTTTTTLINEMINNGGKRSIAAGNIGLPLISVKDKNLDTIVAEVSSYQLETIKEFNPHISLILNITPDHLTRHKTMRSYAAAKAKIFMNQTAEDHLIYNADDKMVSAIVKHAKCNKVPFSIKKELKNGAYLKNGMLYFKGEKIISVSSIFIKGDHNIENCLASAAASILSGIKIPSIIKTLKTFKGVEHRIEFVKKINGVSYFNDSKGTNPESTIVAIKALAKQHGMILILGGRDKLTDLSDMNKLIKKKVKEVILIGEATDRFKKELGKIGYTNTYKASSLKDAVTHAKDLAQKGDAVLLSPACASFDMFDNYEHRGKVFKEIVRNI